MSKNPQVENKSAVSKLAVSRAVAAEMLSVDIQTVDRAIADETLRASKIGRRVLIRVAALDAMLDKHTARRVSDTKAVRR